MASLGLLSLGVERLVIRSSDCATIPTTPSSGGNQKALPLPLINRARGCSFRPPSNSINSGSNIIIHQYSSGLPSRHSRSHRLSKMCETMVSSLRSRDGVLQTDRQRCNRLRSGLRQILTLFPSRSFRYNMLFASRLGNPAIKKDPDVILLAFVDVLVRAAGKIAQTSTRLAALHTYTWLAS